MFSLLFIGFFGSWLTSIGVHIALSAPIIIFRTIRSCSTMWRYISTILLCISFYMGVSTLAN